MYDPVHPPDLPPATLSKMTPQGSSFGRDHWAWGPPSEGWRITWHPPSPLGRREPFSGRWEASTGAPYAGMTGMGNTPEEALAHLRTQIDLQPAVDLVSQRRKAVHRLKTKLEALPPFEAQGPHHKRPYLAQWACEWGAYARSCGPVLRKADIQTTKAGWASGGWSSEWDGCLAVFVYPVSGASRISPPSHTALLRFPLLEESLAHLPAPVRQIIWEELSGR
jgi:hypothetical protein